MKKIFCFLIPGLAALAAGSCTKKDNYDGPTAQLNGRIVDAITGKNVQSEVSGDNGSGTRIKLLETSWSSNPTPLYLATMQDGTYNNNEVFAATYKMTAEGAFVPMVQTASNGTITVDQSQTIDVKSGANTVDFKVEPFLEVEWVGTPVLNSNGTISIQVKVSRGTGNPGFQQNLTDIYLFMNTTKYVGNNNYDSKYVTRLAYSGTAGNTVLGTTLTMTTSGGAIPTHRDVYLRVGARIDYGLKQFNYNEPKLVTIP